MSPPRLNFTRDVRLGDILNIIGFAIAALGAWTTVDTRIVKLEERQGRQNEVNAELRDGMKEMRADLKEVSRSVNAVERRVVSNRNPM